jgi:hypothetical protein
VQAARDGWRVVNADLIVGGVAIDFRVAIAGNGAVGVGPAA